MTKQVDSELEEHSIRTWPDADARLVRRTALHARLDTFLDAFVETKDSGWASATREHISELTDIWREIADLKFERDVDGDSVVNFDVANRQHGRLVSTFVPYPPRNGRADSEEPIQPIDNLDFVKDSLRAARYLISSGEDVMRSLDYNLNDIAEVLPPRERLVTAEARVTALFGADTPWKDAMAEVEKFIEAYPDARESVIRVKDAFLASYGDTPEFVAANAEILDLLTTGRLEDARSVVYELRKLYGVGIREGINAFNEASRVAARVKSDEARARRAAERAADAAR